MANYYYKTDVPCDGVEIIFDQGFATSGEVTPSMVFPIGQVLLPFSYVIGTDNLQVFENEPGSPPDIWTVLSESSYTEIDDGTGSPTPGILTSSAITVAISVTGNVKVIRKSGRLVEGVHYERINSQIIKFNEDPAAYNITKIYTRNPAKSKLNAAKIIDMGAGAIIADVPIWDPGRGHHFHDAIHVVDIQRGSVDTPENNDPALYNIAANSNNVSEQSWNSKEVGTVWFDSSTVGHLPYYDDKVYPQLDDRIFNWGKLASWANINFYQWTKSAVPPEEYDAIAAVEEGDSTIDEQERITGQVKGTPYTRSRNSYSFNSTIETSGLQTITFDPSVYGVTNDNDLTGLVNNFTQQFTATGGVAEVTKIITIADGVGSPSASLEGKYFTIDTPNDGYYVWYTENNESVIVVTNNVSGDVLDAADGSASPSFATGFTFNITTGVNGSPGTAEVTNITCISDISNNLEGKYFTIDTPNGGYYVWYTIGGSPSTDPLVAGRTGVQVTYVSNDSANTIASLTRTAINAVIIGSPTTSEFSAVIPSTDPLVAGRIGIRVVYTLNDLATTIATLTQAAISAGSPSKFAATVTGTPATTVVVTNSVVGDASDVTDGAASPSLATGFTFNITTQGSTAQIFTLSNPYIPNQGILTVTINGLPTTSTETSSTTFELEGTTVNDIIVAIIKAPNYSTEITVDSGTPQMIIINGSVAQNFGQLLQRINDDLVGAIATLNGNEFVITSDSTGASSSIYINDNSNSVIDKRLFQNLINIGPGLGSPADFSASIVDGINSDITVVGHTFNDGDTIRVSSDDTLPTPLVAGGTYVVSATGSPIGTIFQLKDSLGTVIKFTDIGTGTHTISLAVFPTIWTEETNVHEVIDVVYKELQETSGPIPVTKFDVGDVVNIYINEVLLESATVVGGSPITAQITLLSYVLQQQDTIRIIKPAHIITTVDEAFDPDISDDGTIHVQYKNFYNYTEEVMIGGNGIDKVKKYYFWVGNKTVRTIPNSVLSLREAVKQLEIIPTPYMILQNLKPSEVISTDKLPSRYNQIILRGHAGLINDNDRYVLRFTRDLSLRDKLENRENEPMLKNIHTEWELFREKQQFHPRRELWDKITESIIGYRLNDSSKRVPDRERELYDETYGTDTRYGLSDGQIFVDGEIAKTSILTDLNNPDNNFAPTDINVFFENYNFDTAANSILLMDKIYNTFAFDHVNRMLHSVMLDAFAKKGKYPEIFKTSMISLHGIRILETAGLYDE